MWNCLGDGANSGQNASCTANFCQACSGTVGQNNVITSTISGTYTGCAVTGHASYTITNGLSSTDTTMQLQWTDSFYGNFSTLINASGAYRPVRIASHAIRSPKVCQMFR